MSHTLLACLPVAGLAMVIGTSSASAARTPASSKAAAIAALEHFLKDHHSLNHPVGHQSVTHSLTQGQSNNWSGYADTGSKFTKITGSWTEPAVKCGSAEALAVFWVGIDGFSSQTVEQDGSLAFCQGGGAAPEYITWWEMFPSNSIQVVGTTVKPGDHIAASVVRTGTKYALKVTDSTTAGNNFSKNETCAAATCVDSSAEWIAEAPTGSSGIVPLPNFGTWTSKSATVADGGKSGTIKSFADTEITMVDNGGHVKAQPGPLNAKGNQFKVTWKRST